jgi:hypothetical protein
MEPDGLSKLNERGSRAGILALIAGILTAGSVAEIGLTSFTAFDPDGWRKDTQYCMLQWLGQQILYLSLPTKFNENQGIFAIITRICPSLNPIAICQRSAVSH